MGQEVEAVVIGAGAAGLAAAVALKDSSIDDVLVVERDDYLGGILMQCIHNGFGLHIFREELTGPEYAIRYINLAKERQVEFITGTTAIDLKDLGDKKSVTLLSPVKGLVEVKTKVVILAMGCRERTRGNIGIPGTRPAGVMTAGLAQRLMNIEGYMPGREIVVQGSGDIGLIMARRLTWEGANVKAVVEIMPYPGGLNRNIVQCLNDFNIPLYLAHMITNIKGKSRIEQVDVVPLHDNGKPDMRRQFSLSCDTLLLSVGLIPENELASQAGIEIDKSTNGAKVDSNFMTSMQGVFSCGNVLHVHDLVDFVSEEAGNAATAAAAYIRNKTKTMKSVKVKRGNMVRYVLPAEVFVGSDAVLSLRVTEPKENVGLKIRSGRECFYSKFFRKVVPSEMVRFAWRNVPDKCDEVEITMEVMK